MKEAMQICLLCAAVTYLERSWMAVPHETYTRAVVTLWWSASSSMKRPSLVVLRPVAKRAYETFRNILYFLSWSR
jgi:hypothetical protein